MNGRRHGSRYGNQARSKFGSKIRNWRGRKLGSKCGELKRNRFDLLSFSNVRIGEDKDSYKCPFLDLGSREEARLEGCLGPDLEAKQKADLGSRQET